MQVEFTSQQLYFARGYEWYDSDDYTMFLIGALGKSRRKTRSAQRRLQCTGQSEDFTRESLVHFDPFKSAPTMFLEFAELDRSEQSVVEFTNRYGLLWHENGGPSLADYHYAIEDVSDTVRLWKAVQSRDVQQLRKFFAWDRGGKLKWKTVLAQPIPFHGKIIHFVDHRDGLRTFQRGDFVGAGTALLDFVIATRPTWGMHIEPSRRNGAMVLQLEVTDLLSVLWVQFAAAIADDKAYARCNLCGRPFELAPQVNRADRLFCSDTCRVKAYQRRKKQAVALRQAGESPRTIAKETGSDLEMVKKWIGEFESKENSGDEKTQGKR